MQLVSVRAKAERLYRWDGDYGVFYTYHAIRSNRFQRVKTRKRPRNRRFPAKGESL